eukprot:comp24145_c0_seq1/m.43917 comp24145_c0_seq1/g.43917  ORF comp24145_c0_seq1/g.43917 comp24145_c0_seq1/m.43917 type:complete len:327 (+) comp24145_c0_seq1:858-1838(+)
MATDASQTALLSQHRVDILRRVALRLEEQRDGSVDITTSRAHHQTLQGGQTHRRINDLSVLNGSNTRTVTDVKCDEVALGEGLAELFCGAGGDICVTCAVETVSADALLLVVLVVDWVHEGMWGHGLVERRVEARNLRHPGEHLGCHLDAHEVARVVQGRKDHVVLDGLHDLIVDNNGPCEFLPTVHHAVANGVQVHGVQVSRVDQTADLGQTHTVVLKRHLELLAGRTVRRGILLLVVDGAGLLAYALDQTLTHDLCLLGPHHLQQLVLDRRASAVEHKHVLARHCGLVPPLLTSDRGVADGIAEAGRRCRGDELWLRCQLRGHL